MTRVIGEYWFFGLLAVCVFAAWQVSLTPEAIADPIMTERVFLLDTAIILPALYFFYLHTRVALKAAILRSLALAAAGISYAAWLMPDGTGEVLPLLAWLRWVAMPLVIAIELAAFVAIMRYVYGSEPQEEELVRQGLPPLLVKALLIEARFWKRVFRFLAGKND